MDSETFTTEVFPLRDRMFRLARRMLGDEAEAEDAVQDILERLWSRRGELGRYDNLEAMTMVTMRNACLDRIRMRDSRRRGGDRIRAWTETSADGRIPIEMRDVGRIAERIIASLPEKQRLVIHLRDVEGYPAEEIALIAEMEVVAVRMALSRARKTVREQLQKIIDYGNK